MRKRVYMSVRFSLQRRLLQWLDLRTRLIKANHPNFNEPQVLEYIFKDISTLRHMWSKILARYNLNLKMEALFTHSQPQISYFDPDNNLKKLSTIEFGDLLFVYSYKSKTFSKKTSLLYQAKLFRGKVESKQLKQYIKWNPFEFEIDKYRFPRYNLHSKSQKIPYFAHSGARYLFINSPNFHLRRKTRRRHLARIRGAFPTATPHNALKNHRSSNGDMINEIMGLFISETGLSHDKSSMWDDCINVVEDYCRSKIYAKRIPRSERMTFINDSIVRKNGTNESIDTDTRASKFIMILIEIEETLDPKF